jgi:hypothetical protein
MNAPNQEPDVEQLLARAGRAWRAALPTSDDPYPEFARRATHGRGIYASRLLAPLAGVLGILAVAVLIVVSLPPSNRQLAGASPSPSSSAIPSARPSASASATYVPPSPKSSLPPASGRPVRIESATLSADSRVLTLSFIGGPKYVAGDPCSKAYAGQAEEVNGVLEAAVLDVTPPAHLPDGMACTMEGYPRSVTVTLAAPFLGSRLDDRAGYVLFLRRPAGLVEFTGIPSGWLLRSERTVEESPTGRWERIYSPDAVPGGYPELRELDIFQSFDSPVYVGGNGSDRTVQVGDTTGTLNGPDNRGEMVLTWYVGADQIALVANSADFTPEALTALAETATAN